jgi:hypothetical protein
MASMSIKVSRRLFVCLLGSIGALFAFGAGAQQSADSPVIKHAVIGTPFENGVVSLGGPVMAQSMTMSPIGGNGPVVSQKTGSHPYQTIDQTGLPHDVEEQHYKASVGDSPQK